MLEFSFFGIGIDAGGRLILSNVGPAETAGHRDHPVECILSLPVFHRLQAPYLFDPDSDPDFDLDCPNA
ncbi:MAG: hypothetical protein R6Y91_06235 [Desulfohalobium sp.]